MKPKIRPNTEVISHGTHQLGFVFKSSNVFLGETKTSTMRVDSERPSSTGCCWGDDMGGGGVLIVPSLRNGDLMVAARFYRAINPVSANFCGSAASLVV